MRGAAGLLLLGVGLAAGGACSTRSLLTLTLTAEGLSDGQVAAGNPKVAVSRNGETVKEVDKSDSEPDGPFWLVIEGAKSFVLGVYLPKDLAGTVQVTADLVDGECLWHGTKTVDITAGGTTPATIQMSHDLTCMLARQPDGGAISPSDSDAADGSATLFTDGGDDADADDAKDGGDGGEADSAPPTCQRYCMAYLDHCGNQGQVDSLSSCISSCKASAWPDGTHAVPPANTLWCRWDHLMVVGEDAALSCSECFAASPASAGICGPVDAGPPRDACPPSD